MIAYYGLTVAVTAIAVVACVILHYECLQFLTRRLPVSQFRHHAGHRRRIVIVILSLIGLHITEIWIFGGGYFLLLNAGNHGALIGQAGMTLLDCVYYSAMVFTTVGFGDISPTGALRFLSGTEAIAGLTLITWSASYTFLCMQQSWSDNND